MKRRWFFTVSTEKDSLDAIKICYRIIFVIAALRGICIAIVMLYFGKWHNSFTDIIFIIGLAYVLRIRKSRLVAVILMLYTAISGFMLLSAGANHSFSAFVWINRLNVILIVFQIYSCYKGIQGTFAYFKLKGYSVLTRNVFFLAGITSLYLLFYTVVIFILFDIFENFLSEDAVGQIWAVSSVAILTAGYLRKLPFTKKYPTVTSELEPTRLEPSNNYLVKHWRGELSLAKSYWINTAFIGIVFGIAFVLIENSIYLQNNALIKTQVYASLIVLSIVVYIWQIGGCWRSANRHVAESGKAFWARTAQVVLVLGLIQVGNQWKNSTPTLIEMIKIATRTEDFTNYSVILSDDGNEIEVKGDMGFGLENEFKKILDNAPNVQMIRLNSIGGRLEPARKLQVMIQQKRLNTYTDENCSSACIIPFMAGRYRILKTDAKLGFHSYRFPGLELNQMKIEIAIDHLYFQTRGVDSKFLDKAFRIDSKQMWYPEIDELIKAKVITHTYDGENYISYTE